jgi:hypothetical protein
VSAATWSGFSSEQGWTETSGPEGSGATEEDAVAVGSTEGAGAPPGRWEATSGAAAFATSHDFDSSVLSLLNTETKEFPVSFEGQCAGRCAERTGVPRQLNPPSWNFSPG